ncbi:DUF1465 family protein [uncultured Sphingomonas sp.]|uniref:DUF1465 family protein n=1 Tax=uncultured Sphingomonas sp. TaxID=158754 RepID=UPI0035C9DE67
MNGAFTESRVQRRLQDALYVEAMLLADEARSYFDEGSRVEREALPPMARVAFSCESLKVTTRLMHAIAWLLTQRAVAAGELRPCEALDPARRLGTAPMSDAESLAEMPTGARRLIDASIDLHRRVARLDALQEREMAAVSPARSMQQRLALAF